MKRLILSLLALVAVGCASDPEQQLYATQQGYNIAEQTINALHAGGVVSVADKVAIKPSRDVVAAALSAGWDSVLKGDSSGAAVYAAAAKKGMAKLAEFLTAKQGAVAATVPVKAATTQPGK